MYLFSEVKYPTHENWQRLFFIITKPTTRSSSPSISSLPGNINETGKSEWRHTI